MKLDVIQSTTTPWYTEGLKFTCQQCGNCCTGGPGYVWISDEEIERLAEYFKLSTQEVVAKYCRRVNGRLSLKEVRRGALYDCIFLTEQKVESGNGDRVVHTKRGCSIYPVRPLQCRTWPFWEGNLSSASAWKRAGKGCHGIDRGKEFSREQIEKLRDAQDWPENAPTSSE